MLTHGRWHEALGLFGGLYQVKLKYQSSRGDRIHKGMPLVWISDCFYHLGCIVHSKRYLMLTLCEDAVRGEGVIDPSISGVYFRLVWRHGMSQQQLDQYAKTIFDRSTKIGKYAVFPEALLQEVQLIALSQGGPHLERFPAGLNRLVVGVPNALKM